MTSHRPHFSRLAAFCLIALFGIGTMACSDDKAPVDNTPTCTGDNCETTEPCTGDDCGTTEPCTGDDCETTDTPDSHCLAVVTTDYTNGGFAILNMDTLNFATEDMLTSINSDASITATKDALYALNSFGADNLQKMPFADDYAVDWQYSVKTEDDANSPNGQAMVVDGDSGFIAMLAGDVRKVDLNATNQEDFITKIVDIPTIDDFDGSHADVANIKLVDGTLYVLSQGIGDDFSCADGAYGQVLAFDPATLSPKNVFDGDDHLDLQTCNPSGMVVMGDTLYIQSLGAYRYNSDPEDITDDGGIEAIDLSTGTSKGLVLSETEAHDRDIFGIYPAFNGSGLWVVLMDSEAYANPMDLYFLDTTGDTASLSTDSFFQGNIWGAHESADHLFVNTREGDDDGIAVLDPATGDVDPDNFFVTNLPPQSAVAFSRAGGCFEGDE